MSFDTWESFDDLRSGHLGRIVRRVYGPGWRSQFEHLRDESGRIDPEQVAAQAVQDVSKQDPGLALFLTLIEYHEGALRASLLAEYGIHLSQVREEFDLQEIVDLVRWLPAGSAVWRDFGGPAALSREERSAQLIGYRIEQLQWLVKQGKGPKPKLPAPPPYAHEKRVAAEKNRRKAEALVARQQAVIDAAP